MPKKKRFPKLKTDLQLEICHDFRQGLSAREISQKRHCTLDWVYRVKKEYEQLQPFIEVE